MSAQVSPPPPSTPAVRFIPVAQWDKHFAWPTVNGLRYMLANKEINGLAKYITIRRVGSRVLVDPESFFRWVDNNPKGTAPGRVYKEKSEKASQKAKGGAA